LLYTKISLVVVVVVVDQPRFCPGNNYYTECPGKK